MKRILSLLFVLFIFVAGCGPFWAPASSHGSISLATTVYVCLDLPDDQLPAAHAAVEQWDVSLHQWVHLVSIDHSTEFDTSCRVWVHTTTKPLANDPYALAWTNQIGGREITMHVGGYEQDIMGILLHELGHAFGAQHVGGTLMNPIWRQGRYVCPDLSTVSQVAAWNHVSLEMLSWCYY